MSYAAEKVDAEEMVDMATLTGACVVALGPLCSGLFANDQALADRILAAAENAGERVWQLPLIDEYRENLKSDVADLTTSARAAAAPSPRDSSSRSSRPTGRGCTWTSRAPRSSRRTRRWAPRAPPARLCARCSAI